MSYILDALRRADSERERGVVPGIHAQPVPMRSADEEPGRPPAPWRWIVLGVGVGLLVALGWRLFAGAADADQDLARPAAPPAAPTAAVPPRTAAAPPPPAAEEGSPAADAQAGPAAPPPTRRASSVRPAAAAAPAEPAPPRRAARPAPPAEEAAAAPSTRTARAPAKADAPAAAPEVPIRRLEELPEDVRRGVPSMTVGGSIYSNDAASRFLIVNGQTFREKDKLTDDLVLEQIRQKSAVFRIGEYRFELRY